MKECERMCSIGNVCHFCENGERMCAQKFNTTTALIIHFWKEHRLLLCSNCDESFVTISELEKHRHTYERIHDSKIEKILVA